MIKEIERPNIRFNFVETDKYFLENDLFIIINYNWNEKHYLNKNGTPHRLDGYAKSYFNAKYFYINGIYYSNLEFAFKTKHLICRICEDFCNQKCFI